MAIFSSKTWYKNFSAESKQANYLILAAVIALVAVAFGYGYKQFMHYRSTQSQQRFTDAIALFDATAASKTPDWKQTAEMVKATYAEQPRSVTPAMLNVLSDAQVQAGEQAQALQTMDQAVKAISPSDPLYALYRIKHALMLIDTAEEKSVESALATLDEIAANTSAANWDEAAYYLGLYYWEKNDITKAKAVWQNLRDLPLDIEGASPWAARVQAKLPLI